MKNILLCFIITFGNYHSITAQNRYYVKADATGANTGQSWMDAYTDLQTALQTSQPGDEVWVAEGSYKPTNTVARYISFEPVSGLKLYGGFSGNETLLAQRDWMAHPTVLSGDIGAPGDSTDNSINVVYLFQPDSNTVLDGFTICHGLADSISGAGDARDRVICGGGLYIDAGNWDAFPTIQNCRFWHNTAYSIGGGVMIFGTSIARIAPHFVDCLFEENHSHDTGGGLARYGGSWIERGVEFERCFFSWNRAEQRGGGLFYNDSKGINTITLHGCTFDHNSAVFNGGGAFFGTGKTGKSGLYIQNTVFEANSAGKAAAMNVFTNGENFDGEAVIDSCVFAKNVSKYIGTSAPSIIDIDQFGTPQTMFNLTNTRIEDNVSDGHNTIIGWYEANKALVENTLFVRNSASILIHQDAFFISEIRNSIFTFNKLGALGEFSNEVCFKYSNCLFEKNTITNKAFFNLTNLKKFILLNSIFYNNKHPLGYYDELLSSTAIDTLFLTNTVMTDSITRFSFAGNGSTYLLNNSFGFIDCNDQFPNVTCGLNNLTGLDPLFRDTANGDYTLLPCSPLIDAGSNAAAAGISTDLAGAPRIQGGTVDIGAYEAPAFALSTPPDISAACSDSPGGAISLSPAFGCEPYSYTWQPPVGNGAVVNGLPPGSYAVTVTDSHGKVIQDTLNVPTAPSPELSPVTSDFQCGSLSGGTATVTISSGTYPFSFNWSNQASDSLLTMLPAGQYQVTVTDANGCQDSTEMSISKEGQLTLMVDGEAISCFGASDGTLSAAALSGKAPFTYLWSPTGVTDSVLTNLGPGGYIVTATDFYGCTASFSFTLSEPAQLQAAALAQSTSSVQNPNGSASASPVSGGTQPYSYFWSNGGQSQSITSLAPGIYTVTVTDAHGCTTTASAEVTFVSGTHELADLQVQVWPNPMAERLEIEAPALPSGDWRLVLRDVLGREVAGGSLIDGRAVLATGGLVSGVYEWVLMDGGMVVRSGKVVK